MVLHIKRKLDSFDLKQNLKNISSPNPVCILFLTFI